MSALLIFTGRWDIERFENRNQDVATIELQQVGYSGWKCRVFNIDDKRERQGMLPDELLASFEFKIDPSATEIEVLAKALRRMSKKEKSE